MAATLGDHRRLTPRLAGRAAGDRYSPDTAPIDYVAIGRHLASRLPPADRVSACTTLDITLQWAEELGLRGTLQDLSTEAAWLPGVSAAERANFAGMMYA